MRTRRVHCWADRMAEDGRSYTCMAWAGHKGPHQWVPDNEITIAFAPKEASDDER